MYYIYLCQCSHIDVNFDGSASKCVIELYNADYVLCIMYYVCIINSRFKKKSKTTLYFKINKTCKRRRSYCVSLVAAMAELHYRKI